MNKSQFQAATGISDELVSRWYVPVSVAMGEFSITDPVAQAMFLAQAGHESVGFTRVLESLNYSANGLQRTFGKYFTAGEAQQYGRTDAHPANQRTIAKRVYGGRMGNDGPDDGWTYRGRGLIQITGRQNYAACGDGLKKDLLLVPQLLEQESYAARSAGWFWNWRGCNKQPGSTEAVTRLINGGTNGLAERKKLFEKARAVLCN